MKDEEMAEEYAEEYQIRKHHQRLYGNKPVVMKELNTTYKDGFLAGLKAGRLALNYIAELEEKVQGYDRNRDRLISMGFPTFQSCKEYADKIKELETQIEKMKCCGNCKGVCNSDDTAYFCKNNNYKLWEIEK